VQGRRLWPIVLLLGGLLPACDEPAGDTPPPPRRPDPEAGSRFDPSTASTISGTVCWQGPIPHVPPFRAVAEPLTDLGVGPAHDWPNPNAPRVDPGSRGVSSAVVLLRHVDPRRARPWDHPAVRVEMKDWQLRVRQGPGPDDQASGFVRAGETVAMVSRQKSLGSVQGRGAAFFALSLPRPGQARTRRLESPGVVELMSGTGQFWIRAYLFVSHHPYLARTDRQGRFRLDRVPPGEYDLVAWHPDWRVREQERNPELFRVQQVRFRPPFETVRRIRVRTGQVETCDLTLSPP
jgi:hypothetical protein